MKKIIGILSRIFQKVKLSADYDRRSNMSAMAHLEKGNKEA